MSFKAVINYEYKDFLAWVKVNAKTSRKVLNIITTVLMIVASLCMAAGMGTLIILDAVETDMLMMAFIFLICMIYLLFKSRITAKISQKSFIKGVGTVELTVDDEGISSHSAVGEDRYYFSAVKSFYFGEEHFFLLLDKNHAIIVPKRSFTEGEPESFAAFICEKTGLEDKFIKY